MMFLTSVSQDTRNCKQDSFWVAQLSELPISYILWDRRRSISQQAVVHGRVVAADVEGNQVQGQLEA